MKRLQKASSEQMQAAAKAQGVAVPLSATPPYATVPYSMPQTPPQHQFEQALTFEELRALTTGVSRLENTDTPRFTRLVRLIQKAMPDFDGEIVLDCLDVATLRQMQQVVSEAQVARKARAKKPPHRPRIRAVVGTPPAAAEQQLGAAPVASPLTTDAVNAVAVASGSQVEAAGASGAVRGMIDLRRLTDSGGGDDDDIDFISDSDSDA